MEPPAPGPDQAIKPLGADTGMDVGCPGVGATPTFLRHQLRVPVITQGVFAVVYLFLALPESVRVCLFPKHRHGQSSSPSRRMPVAASLEDTAINLRGGTDKATGQAWLGRLALLHLGTHALACQALWEEGTEGRKG